MAKPEQRNITPDTIREFDSQLTEIEQTIANANKTRQKIRQRFKSETGIKLNVLDAARKMANIEDNEIRQQFMIDYSFIYSTLQPGENMQLQFPDGTE